MSRRTKPDKDNPDSSRTPIKIWKSEQGIETVQVVHRSRTTGETKAHVFLFADNTAPKIRSFEEWTSHSTKSTEGPPEGPPEGPTEGDTVLATWAWLLDVFLEINIEQWSAVNSGIYGEKRSPWFRGQDLNIAHIARSVTNKAESKEIEDRTVRKHVEEALPVIKSQWSKVDGPRAAKALNSMYATLYYLAQATIDSWNASGNTPNFDADCPYETVDFFTTQFGCPAELSQVQAAKCLNRCWQ